MVSQWAIAFSIIPNALLAISACPSVKSPNLYSISDSHLTPPESCPLARTSPTQGFPPLLREEASLLDGRSDAANGQLIRCIPQTNLVPLG